MADKIRYKERSSSWHLLHAIRREDLLRDDKYLQYLSEDVKNLLVREANAHRMDSTIAFRKENE
jgi:hypothetical protein